MYHEGTWLGENVKHEFYGEYENSCAWCSKSLNGKWYIAEIDTDEWALYHVCDNCHKERVGDE